MMSKEWIEFRKTGYKVNSKGDILGLRGRIISQYIGPKGYPQVSLSINKKNVSFRVHRIVCEVFNGKPKGNRTHVNHKDSNRANNVCDNLEWVSPSENSRHCSLQGRHCKGILNKNSVVKLLSEYRMGVPRKALAVKYKVSKTTVRDVIAGRAWGYVTGVVYAKGSNKTGELAHASKLKEFQVLDIIEGLSDGFTHKEIATYYNVSPNTISALSRGLSWSSVTGINTTINTGSIE